MALAQVHKLAPAAISIYYLFVKETNLTPCLRYGRGDFILQWSGIQTGGGTA